MARQTDIPPEEVGRVIQDYVDEGKTKITAEEQADGNWTVKATKT